METLEVTKANAIKAFQSADAKGKKLLTDLYGEKTFTEKITDRIKTFGDVLRALPTIPQNVGILLSYNGTDKDMIGARAFMQITLIARVLNEGWEPDWTNSSEWKYYPWLKFKTGVGFSDSVFGNSYASATVGSRLCYKTSELAEYAGTQFQSIYNDFLLTNPIY